jgi:hypothetical protein
MDLLAQVESEVGELSEEDLRAELTKVTVRRTAQAEKNKTRNANLTPEQKEARKDKQAEYNAQPEVKAKRKAYMERDDVKERQTRYRKEKYARDKAILDRARALGITADSDSASA